MVNVTGNPVWANLPATSSPIDEDALNNIEDALNGQALDIADRAPIDSPNFVGPVMAETVDAGTTGDQLVTAAWVLEKISEISSVVGTRVTATYTTASIAASTREMGLFVSNAQAILVSHMQVSAYARVRLYDSTPHRDADAARGVGVNPSTLTNVGVLADMQMHAEDGLWTMAPEVPIVSLAGNKIPITVDNLGPTSTAITVTITYVILQE